MKHLSIPKVISFVQLKIYSRYIKEIECLCHFACLFYMSFSSNVLNRDPTDQELEAYCFENYHSESVSNYDKRIEGFHKQMEDSQKLFPFLSHHACKNCIDNPKSSPSARLNKTYADFARQIDQNLYSFFSEHGMLTNLS